MTENQLSYDWLESELVIGLVCPVGTESPLVVQILTETLNRAGYEVKVVKISVDVIPTLIQPEYTGDRQFDRYDELMTIGNQCRKQAGDDSILAYGAAMAIEKFRRGRHPSGDSEPLSKTAFIIDSLKRPEEVDALRIIYPSGFLLLGIHDEENRRIRHLTETKGMSKKQATRLVERDRNESKAPSGQRVNATFHLADCFVQLMGNHDRLRADVRRIVELCFGNPFITPTFDEFAMFQAFSTALRSADLSRQVGAVITRDQQIIATGANDCPKAGGGLYWPRRTTESGCVEDHPDGRDFKLGYDSNRREQIKITEELSRKIGTEFNLKWKKVRKVLEDSAIGDLTEYGRVVHAEMEALLSCCRLGIPVLAADLYSTTFPCHNCAKHIIASGIRRVVYVEPYAKSKALAFHGDAILTAGENLLDKENRVRFEPFVGIGPRRFFELFSMNLGSSYALNRKVKESGEKRPWKLESARLRLQMNPISYIQLEQSAVQRFGKAVTDFAPQEVE